MSKWYYLSETMRKRHERLEVAAEALIKFVRMNYNLPDDAEFNCPHNQSLAIARIFRLSNIFPRAAKWRSRSRQSPVRGGRAKGTPNKLPKGERALVKLDAAEAEVRALVAEGLPLETLGKDRLTDVAA